MWSLSGPAKSIWTLAQGMRPLPGMSRSNSLHEVVVMIADKYYIVSLIAQYQHPYEATRHKNELSSSYDWFLCENRVTVQANFHVFVVVL